MESTYLLLHQDALKRFAFDLGKNEFAEITYHLEADVFSLDHTGVPESHAGKGIAQALAEAVFGWLRENGSKARLRCPFLLKYMQRHPEWNDILA